MQKTNPHDPFFYEDEGSDLSVEIINKYFQMLKEVEWGYKDKPVILSNSPTGPNHFYQLHTDQNKEN